MVGVGDSARYSVVVRLMSRVKTNPPKGNEMTNGTELLIKVSDVTDPAWQGLSKLTDLCMDDEQLHDLARVMVAARRTLLKVDAEVLLVVKSFNFRAREQANQ